VSSPLVLLVSIAAIAAWTVWIVRSDRAGRWVQGIPVVTAIVAGGLQLLSMHAIQQTLTGVAQANPADKASNLADGLGRASVLASGKNIDKLRADVAKVTDDDLRAFATLLEKTPAFTIELTK